MDVKTLCLGVLTLGPATGYDIRKHFEEGPFSHFQDAAFASIYPALRKLAEEGLIVGTEEPQDSRPDRRVYRLTAAGRQALYAALLKPPGPDKVRSDFLFVTFFGDRLPAGVLDRMIEERMAALRRQIAHLEGCEKNDMEAGRRFTLGFGLAVYRAELAYLEVHGHELVGAAMLRDDVAE